jgi:hypothetical protein
MQSLRDVVEVGGSGGSLSPRLAILASMAYHLRLPSGPRMSVPKLPRPSN